MKLIEAAQEAYDNCRDPMQSAITAFLDGILADPEAPYRITLDAVKIQRETELGPDASFIEALKKEVWR